MYPSTNTCFGPTTSTNTTTLAPVPYNSSYVKHNDFTNTIKDLVAEFNKSVK